MAGPEPKPLRIAYDIHRLSAGGANGGIKVHHYEFLRAFVETHSHELQLHIFCQEEIIPELDFLSAKGNHQIHILGSRAAIEPRNTDGSLPPLHYWPSLPENLLVLLEIDVLYAGFGFSPLYTPEVPQISLIVDVLHRSYPESLPPAEVKFRDNWYAREIARSTLIQTNSQFCKQQLIDEFGADPEKVFTIALPLHGRFNRVEMAPLPKQLQNLEHKYFLYPANYWPHKNHERLIEAYALYEKEAGQEALHLVLTGQINELGQKIAARIQELDLSDKIHQIGHLDLPSYKTVWELAHSLVFPSLYEGFGLPLLEAMYFQKPTLCSDAPYSLEIASPQTLICKLIDPQQVARSLKTIQANPAAHTDHASTLERFNYNTEVQKLVTNFQTVSTRNRTIVAKGV